MKPKAQKQQELAKKRTEETTRPISVRLNSREEAIVAEKAATKGMKPSTYMGYVAVHGCDGISPAEKVRFQNVINRAADALEAFAPEKAAKIRMEGDAIWDL